MSDGGDDRTLSERLSAYLDGELDKNDADSIRKLIVTDSKIAKVARDLAEAKVRLESAYGDTRDEPISETTIDLIKNYPMGRPTEDRAEPVRSNIIPIKDAPSTHQRWLIQITRYHRVYACMPRDDLVKTEENKLTGEDWVKMLGRDLPIPDLQRHRMSFEGARLLTINDEPAAQLVYTDTNNSLLTFWIAQTDQPASEPQPSIHQDLDVITWCDGVHAYALVGRDSRDSLSQLVPSIRSVYRT
jgi:anti-sigma factor RsiW